MKKYRLLRVLEYEGDLEWIRWQMGQSLHGERVVPSSLKGMNFPYPPGVHGGGVIRAATIGSLPQLIDWEVDDDDLLTNEQATKLQTLYSKLDFIVSFLQERGLLEDGVFTFPDGDQWRAR